MHHGFNLQDVRDRNVIDAQGDNVGKVVDVVIDPHTWRVSHFLVQLRRDLEPEITGRQRALFETGGGHTFELAAERVRSVGDNVVLNIGLSSILERLRAADGHLDRADHLTRAEEDRLRFGRPDLYAPTTMAAAPRADDDLPPMP